MWMPLPPGVLPVLSLINEKFEKEEFEKLGLNYSNYHIDVMFGDDSITIQAISKNKEIKLLMENGEWRV